MAKPEQRKVVGFRGARGEDDLLCIGVDQRPDGGSCFLHRAGRLPADRMLGRVRVAKGIMPERRHGLDDAGVRGCRGLIVRVHEAFVAHVLPASRGQSVPTRYGFDDSRQRG